MAESIIALDCRPAPALPCDPHASIVDLFEAQVRRTPSNRAVLSEDVCLTYDQLNAEADRVARYLVQSGIGTEDIVALFLDRSPELIAAILGTGKAGAAF